MVEYTIPAWEVRCFEGKVLMSTEAAACVPSRRFDVQTSIEIGYTRILSLGSLLELRDQAVAVLERSSYERKEQLLPLVLLTRENVQDIEAVQAWAETLLMLPSFDAAFFFRVVSSQRSNGLLFMSEFQREPSEANATSLLSWAAGVDDALKKYAAICLTSRSFERDEPRRDRRWAICVRFPMVEAVECAG